MLIVAIAFEILNHFLSHAKERAQNAKYGLELELAKYQGFANPEKPESVISQNDGGFKESSIGFNAPIGKPATAHYSPTLVEYDKSLFRYQQSPPKQEEKPSFGFIPSRMKAQTDKPEIRESNGFKQSPEQLARARELAADDTGSTYRQTLRNGSKSYQDTPLDSPTGSHLQATVGNSSPLQGTVYTGDCSTESDAYKTAMDAPTGSKIACPNCGAVVVKRNQQHTFCSNSRKPRSDGGNCSDDWHNARNPERLAVLKARGRKRTG